jgi:hypothetical protein
MVRKDRMPHALPCAPCSACKALPPRQGQGKHAHTYWRDVGPAAVLEDQKSSPTTWRRPRWPVRPWFFPSGRTKSSTAGNTNSPLWWCLRPPPVVLCPHPAGVYHAACQIAQNDGPQSPAHTHGQYMCVAITSQFRFQVVAHTPACNTHTAQSTHQIGNQQTRPEKRTSTWASSSVSAWCCVRHRYVLRVLHLTLREQRHDALIRLCACPSCTCCILHD